jgi:hypothetical protein
MPARSSGARSLTTYVEGWKLDDDRRLAVTMECDGKHDEDCKWEVETFNDPETGYHEGIRSVKWNEYLYTTVNRLYRNAAARLFENRYDSEPRYLLSWIGGGTPKGDRDMRFRITKNHQYKTGSGRCGIWCLDAGAWIAATDDEYKGGRYYVSTAPGAGGETGNHMLPDHCLWEMVKFD